MMAMTPGQIGPDGLPLAGCGWNKTSKKPQLYTKNTSLKNSQLDPIED